MRSLGLYCRLLRQSSLFQSCFIVGLAASPPATSVHFIFLFSLVDNDYMPQLSIMLYGDYVCDGARQNSWLALQLTHHYFRRQHVGSRRCVCRTVSACGWKVHCAFGAVQTIVASVDAPAGGVFACISTCAPWGCRFVLCVCPRSTPTYDAPCCRLFRVEGSMPGGTFI